MIVRSKFRFLPPVVFAMPPTAGSSASWRQCHLPHFGRLPPAQSGRVAVVSLATSVAVWVSELRCALEASFLGFAYVVRCCLLCHVMLCFAGSGLG